MNMNKIDKLLLPVIVILILFVSTVRSMQSYIPMPVPRIQFADANGIPVANGKLYTCIAGSACPGTTVTTYTDAAGGASNTNPIVLDSSGRATVFVPAGVAIQYVLYDASSVQVTGYSIDAVRAGPFNLGTMSAFGVLFQGSGITASIYSTSAGTNNQVLMGHTSAAPSFTSTPILTSLTIGTAGSALTFHRVNTASLDFAAWAGNDCQGLTVTVTGATDGDGVTLGIPNTIIAVATTSTLFTGYVSAADTVTVRGCKVTAGASADPAAATVRAEVWR